jgi:hypothetical protein
MNWFTQHVILGTRPGRYVRKMVECFILHKLGYGLVGRHCRHWSANA